MTDDDLLPFARRALGSAIVTGSQGASFALEAARPAATDALAMAYEAALEARKAALSSGRDGLRSVREASRPALDAAFEAKRQLRRRAVGQLPPGASQLVEGMRHQRIEAEKLAYNSARRLVKDLEPARELAWAKSQNLLAEAVNAFGDVAQVALATSLKFGEEMQRGDFDPPRPRAQAKRPAKPSARRRPAKR
jgi:hypothetical protein